MSELKISPELLQISPEVQDALKNKKPVVALESTIISHGMPFPQNAQTAIEVEETIRKQGAVPATIAIIGGVMKVGLSKEEIELLGREGHNVTKVSRRDLPFVVAAGKNGATTVASTMIIAALAGIKVFATGGIGGVHRGAEHTFDISADLQELANTNVTVVCAGAKSILDLGLTTEYLETFGVPLIGYQTKALPAFFCRTSPFEVSIRLDSATEIARAMAVKWQSGLNGGLVVANPIPEQFAMPEESINAAIDQAVAEAEEQGVIGKESTPFLLARVAELTGGDSLKSNIQLVFNNAILASEIARAMAVKWQSGLNGGLVVANPIPEQFAMPEHTINAAIDQAVAEAEAQGVIGKESTPFLLARVAELTGGDSLKSNIQLVFNNAILASEIAKEYQRLAG